MGQEVKKEHRIAEVFAEQVDGSVSEIVDTIKEDFLTASEETSAWIRELYRSAITNTIEYFVEDNITPEEKPASKDYQAKLERDIGIVLSYGRKGVKSSLERLKRLIRMASL